MLQSVKQAIAQLANIKPGDKRFDFPCPVCWFGNLNSDKPIILTMGINPSYKEFIGNRFRGFKGSWSYTNPQDCIDAYNGYFKGQPYSAWFDEQEAIINCKSSHAKGSRAIKYLSGFKSLDASYYDDTVSNVNTEKPSKYQLVHVDLFPFATNPTWGGLKLTPQFKSLLFNYGLQLIADIIAKYEPKLILSFGGFESKKSALKEYFGNDFVLKNAVQIPQKSNFSKLTPRKMAEGSITINGIKTPIIVTSAVAADVNRIYGITNHVDHLLILADKYLTGAKLPI